MFEKFNTLHRNQTLAFVDGVICGLVAYHMAMQFVDDHRNEQELKKLAEKNKRSMYDPKPL